MVSEVGRKSTVAKISKQVESILASNASEMIQKLQLQGESIKTICAATGMSRATVSLVGNGHRTLGESYYRQLIHMAIDRNIF